MNPLLRIENLSIDFITGKQRTTAVRNLSLEVKRGEILALVGESGSGKSVTSLSILRLLPSPPAIYASGKILFSERANAQPVDLLKTDEETIRSIRGARIAMIFQEPMTSLNPVMSCGRQIMEAIRVHHTSGSSEARDRAVQWLGKAGLPSPEMIFHRYPHELSGGQKQRVMIAMAMCCQPSLLICDEPTTALDVTVQKTILDLIRRLQQEENMGVLFITHDLGVVSDIANRVAIMYKGEIVEENETSRIFQDPRHPYTKALIACRPVNHPKGRRLPVVADFMNAAAPSVSPQKEWQAEKKKAALEELVRVEDLVVRFPGRTGFFGGVKNYVKAVDGVSFQLYKGETLGLVGESGCGKTTLGRTLLRLIEPASGRIIHKGRDITDLPKKEWRNLRKDIQLVFQDPFSSLNPRLSIGTALSEPMKIAGIEKSSERKSRVAELLKKVDLSPAMMRRYPHEFSGGQRQRIVIARALSLNPGLLVCDESVSALDVSVQAQVLNLLNELKNELGLTMVFISHDLSVVRYMCDRILVMKAGKIIESGDAEEVYRHPRSEYTRQLIAAIPGREGGL